MFRRQWILPMGHGLMLVRFQLHGIFTTFFHAVSLPWKCIAWEEFKILVTRHRNGMRLTAGYVKDAKLLHRRLLTYFNRAKGNCFSRINHKKWEVPMWATDTRTKPDVNRTNWHEMNQCTQCSHSAFSFTELCATCMNIRFSRFINHVSSFSSDACADPYHKTVLSRRYTDAKIDDNRDSFSFAYCPCVHTASEMSPLTLSTTLNINGERESYWWSIKRKARRQKAKASKREKSVKYKTV